VPRVDRQTVDLTGYPDLVVVYLGMRVRRAKGMRTLFGLGPQIDRSWKARPDGLLRHENFVWSLLPPHVGMRQYWRDLESLEAWTRSEPHRKWWLDFMRDTGGTGFWHEAYFMRGGIDAIYDDIEPATGLAAFAPTQVARGQMFSSRRRAGQDGEVAAPVVGETELYGSETAPGRP
jgi:Domain of unknown function (DUF4188)